MNAYQPTSLGTTILTLVFYITIIGFAIYSLIALYALLRFGRSKILSMTITILYLIIAAGLYAAAITNLHAIRF
ncbi:MAG: hypothetical protein A2660_02950 [Candidatus Doudnabacteria bacterium RIFCSPHIGHO2_01_FULL_45_18]|uniref:Uncharacterized protein n=1 Tax=Candidatus Doudnabacteria bacterium RIFCSPHIGHO2_01_FULL_45_18 TaxID=1817823 RepID=A0A1F5NQR3_9BACT|nr:MAG: hypothetical protein A2660_02950 [Candidatus Doudnabacteria bacterium RIFCSPHIGHO2_01_FULL_45_18]